MFQSSNPSNFPTFVECQNKRLVFLLPKMLVPVSRIEQYKYAVNKGHIRQLTNQANVDDDTLSIVQTVL